MWHLTLQQIFQRLQGFDVARLMVGMISFFAALNFKWLKSGGRFQSYSSQMPAMTNIRRGPETTETYANTMIINFALNK